MPGEWTITTKTRTYLNTPNAYRIHMRGKNKVMRKRARIVHKSWKEADHAVPVEPSDGGER